MRILLVCLALLTASLLWVNYGVAERGETFYLRLELQILTYADIGGVWDSDELVPESITRI